MFGVNADGWVAGQAIAVDASANGYPIRSLKDVPAGEYTVQAVLNKYETFHRSDGKTIKLHPDMGEGQHWNISPGNLYSKPKKVTIAAGSAPINVELTEVIPPIEPPKRHEIHPPHPHPVAAADQVLGPADVSSAPTSCCRRVSTSTPKRTIPLSIFHGHFRRISKASATTPPDPNLKPDYSERFHLAGYNRIQQQEAYKFYQQWTAPSIPALSGRSRSSTPTRTTTIRTP